MTKLILSAPARCIKALLAMVLLPPPPSPTFGREDNACSTNVNRSPTTWAHAVCQGIKARASSDRPLPAGRAGSKVGKGNGGNDDGNAGGCG